MSREDSELIPFNFFYLTKINLNLLPRCL